MLCSGSGALRARRVFAGADRTRCRRWSCVVSHVKEACRVGGCRVFKFMCTSGSGGRLENSIVWQKASPCPQSMWSGGAPLRNCTRSVAAVAVHAMCKIRRSFHLVLNIASWTLRPFLEPPVNTAFCVGGVGARRSQANRDRHALSTASTACTVRTRPRTSEAGARTPTCISADRDECARLIRHTALSSAAHSSSRAK